MIGGLFRSFNFRLWVFVDKLLFGWGGERNHHGQCCRAVGGWGGKELTIDVRGNGSGEVKR